MSNAFGTGPVLYVVGLQVKCTEPFLLRPECYDIKDCKQTMSCKSTNDECQPKSHSAYNIRDCEDLQIPRYRSEFAKKALITQLSNYGIIPLPNFVS